jgi:hypothetical protein
MAAETMETKQKLLRLMERDWSASNATVNISVCKNVMRVAYANGVKYFAKFSSVEKAQAALAQINRDLASVASGK